MKEKSIDSRADGCLVLILPIAFLLVFLFKTWPLLLALLASIASYNAWQRYQWQQWSQQVNPTFHQLIQENQGRITPLDLAMRANFSATTAKRYLDNKAEEFGAQRQNYEDLGNVYYFLTSSTLGSVLDKSEPPRETEPHDQQTKDVEVSVASNIDKSLQEESVTTEEVINSELETNNHQFVDADTISQVSEATVEQAKLPDQTHIPKSLIQSELAKRLDVYSSTVYKHRDDPDFDQWSRSRDPDGIAWKYLPESKEFCPMEE